MKTWEKYLAVLVCTTGLGATPALAIDFGDDKSEYAYDDECDDPRFSGAKMADQLLTADIMHDATDCILAFQEGSIIYGPPAEYGDDASPRAHNGICDDPRYRGLGLSRDVLTDADIMHDATDCWQADKAGRLRLIGDAAPGAEPMVEESTAPETTTETEEDVLAFETPGEIDFGDDSSDYANDGECDDPRFEGSGMTTTTLLEGDAMHDATDCKTAFDAGTITLK